MDVADLLRSRRLTALRREPLLHFLILGLALFAAQAWLRRNGDARTIVVPASALQGMRQDHLRRTGAAPTAAEQAALLQRYLDDEVRYREALALGLDRGDVIVRRRLLQKMDFLLEGDSAPQPPTDAELQQYLTAHSGRYLVPDRVTLQHVFVARGREDDGDAADSRAAVLRDALIGGADPATLGDPFLRGTEFRQVSERDLAGVFGLEFARRAMTLPADEWAGPIRSSYGSHVVRITEPRAGRVPSLDAVRDAVLRDWRNEQRDARSRAALDRLRASYAVKIETEPGAMQASAPASSAGRTP